jgi:PhnB protein
MGSDCPPGMYEAPKGLSVAIGVATDDEADRVFNALAAGGNVIMPLQQTFWSSRFGMLTDKFGISWMVNTDPKVS